MVRMELNYIIRVFDEYANKNKKFEEFQKKVGDIKKKYLLNDIIDNYTQDDIYPLRDDSAMSNKNFKKKRKQSFLREVCNEKIMGTTFGANFSSYVSFFQKKNPNSLDLFKAFMKTLLDIKSDDFYRSFQEHLVKKGYLRDLYTLKTALIQIISCCYPENFFPIYKLEGILPALNDYGVKTDDLLLENKEVFGQNILKLNRRLKEIKDQNKTTAKWDNIKFTHFLFLCFPINTTLVIQKLGFRFFEKNEQFVVALFSKIHQKLGFKHITRIKTSFPDAEVEDVNGNVKQVEFEFNSEAFKSHKNRAEECDIIVCWYDDLDINWKNEYLRSDIQIIKFEDLIDPTSELSQIIFN